MPGSRKWYRNRSFWELVERAGNPPIPAPGEKSEHPLSNGEKLHLLAYDNHCIAATTPADGGRGGAHWRQEYPLHQTSTPCQKDLFEPQ